MTCRKLNFESDLRLSAPIYVRVTHLESDLDHARYDTESRSKGRKRVRAAAAGDEEQTAISLNKASGA
jgi:hypothetical protein